MAAWGLSIQLKRGVLGIVRDLYLECEQLLADRAAEAPAAGAGGGGPSGSVPVIGPGAMDDVASESKNAAPEGSPPDHALAAAEAEIDRFVPNIMVVAARVLAEERLLGLDPAADARAPVGAADSMAERLLGAHTELAHMTARAQHHLNHAYRRKDVRDRPAPRKRKAPASVNFLSMPLVGDSPDAKSPGSRGDGQPTIKKRGRGRPPKNPEAARTGGAPAESFRKSKSARVSDETFLAKQLLLWSPTGAVRAKNRWCHMCKSKRGDVVVCNAGDPPAGLPEERLAAARAVGNYLDLPPGRRSEKRCSRSFCRHCLAKSYGENTCDIAKMTKIWSCPICRDICLCDTCFAKRSRNAFDPIAAKRLPQDGPPAEPAEAANEASAGGGRESGAAQGARGTGASEAATAARSAAAVAAGGAAKRSSASDTAAGASAAADEGAADHDPDRFKLWSPTGAARLRMRWCHMCHTKRGDVVVCNAGDPPVGLPEEMLAPARAAGNYLDLPPGQRSEKRCGRSFCRACLSRNYGENIEEIAGMQEIWSCPKCRNICLCDPCFEKRRREGFSPEEAIRILPEFAIGGAALAASKPQRASLPAADAVPAPLPC